MAASSVKGQVFEYDPEAETLKLIYESQSAADCENPDNITVTPRGGLLLCEDNAGPTTNAGERLLGLTLDGEIFTFALNNVDLTSNVQRARAGRQLSPGRMGGRLLQPRRQVAVRQHPDAGHHLRDYRAVERRAALSDVLGARCRVPGAVLGAWC